LKGEKYGPNKCSGSVIYYYSNLWIKIIRGLGHLATERPLNIMYKKLKLTNHFINGDKKTNYLEDFIYVIFFIFEVLNDKRAKPDNSQSSYYKNIILDYYEKGFFLKMSPSRILCHFFLLNWLKNNFSRDDNVNILDVGCGNTVALTIFKKYFKNFQYYGCDFKTRDKWDSIINKNVFLFEQKIEEEIKIDLPQINIIHSQSVFEHVEYDLSGFQQLSKKFKKARQIHFLPAPISFLNYEKHGFRRYSLRALENLKRELEKENMKIYNLGGSRAFKYHFNFLEKNNFKKFNLSKILKFKNDINDEIELLKFLFSDKDKSFPVFYAIDF